MWYKSNMAAVWRKQIKEWVVWRGLWLVYRNNPSMFCMLSKYWWRMKEFMCTRWCGENKVRGTEWEAGEGKPMYERHERSREQQRGKNQYLILQANILANSAAPRQVIHLVASFCIWEKTWLFCPLLFNLPRHENCMMDPFCLTSAPLWVFCFGLRCWLIKICWWRVAIRENQPNVIMKLITVPLLSYIHWQHVLLCLILRSQGRANNFVSPDRVWWYEGCQWLSNVFCHIDHFKTDKYTI